MQLIIYCNNISPRVEYIFSTVFNALGLNDCNITADLFLYETADTAKINYSDSPIATNEVWIRPVDLLFESDIHQQEIEVYDWNGHKAFFHTSEEKISFDIFAASFYLITRYEEYLPHNLDSYKRYAHENSIAYKEGFLDIPLVNLWLKEFTSILLGRFPLLKFTPASFSYLPTYDIDIAWSYLHKGWVRNAGGFAKSLFKGKSVDSKERINVLQGKLKDPFDSYEWLNGLHKQYGLKPVYFFLVAEKNKGYDKNILPSVNEFQELIKEHGKKYEVGIHPSWQSSDDDKLLNKETKLLSGLIQRPIIKSRQHYIRMSLPQTYRKLIDSGITEDYSMGYGSTNGFRASYCLPHNWFDLEKNEKTSLTLFPFCYMEANSFYEQHYTSEQALDEMKHYYDVVKEVNGLLITIWHNHFLGTDNMFSGWKESYSSFLEEVNSEVWVNA